MAALTPHLMKAPPLQQRDPASELLLRIEQQISMIIVGKSSAVRLALACLLARGHLLIEDIPGVGKTTLAQALGTTLGLPFRRIQFTSDLLPADIIGVSIYDATQHTFRFQPGPIFTSVVLADEVNRAPPKTQSALLEAMEERQVSSDGQTRLLPEPFFVIATQNPTEQSGAYPLPESQLDRFLMCIELGYPDATAERELLAGGDRRVRLAHLGALCDAAALIDLQHRAAQVHVSPALLDYVQALIAKSRTTERGVPGLSPRAGLNLLNASRAWAMLEQRAMVLPEDVQAVFASVAGHRLAADRRRGLVRALELVETVPVS